MDLFLDNLLQWTGQLAGMIWWPLNIVLLFSVSILMTVMTSGIQFRKLFLGFKLIFAGRTKKDSGEITPFQALMTGLAGTVGNGNIAGVATAIAAGGPGAVFWMWISALFGMATKYSEALLGRLYRQKADTEYFGGPMYYISALKGKLPAAGFFAAWYAFAIMLVGSIGSGNMAQSNSIALALSSQFSVPPILTALILLALIAFILFGGIKRIANVSEKMVPLMILAYVSAALLAVIFNADKIPAIFSLIIESALSGEAALGGVAGHTVKQAMQLGVSRGVLSNESGLGSVAIPAAAAQGKEAVPQALIAMMGSFIDTIIVCSMTGFIILSSGVYGNPDVASVAITKTAFEWGLGSAIGAYLVSICSIIFGFSTILAYAYFSEQGFHYLFPKGNVLKLRIIIILAAGAGALLQGDYLGIVWNTSDIANGLMVFPNLVALLFLVKVVRKETKSYFTKLDSGELKDYFGN